MEERQLQIFALTETDLLNQKIQGCISSTDNLRRGMFSRHDALFKMYGELKNDVEEVKKEVAKLRVMLAMFSQDHFIPHEIGEAVSEKIIRFCP
jgi:hypothetical protein